MSVQQLMDKSPEFRAYVEQTRNVAQARIKELATTLAAGTSIDEMPLVDELKETLKKVGTSMESILVEGISSELNQAMHGCNALHRASGLPAHRFPMIADAMAELLKSSARDVASIKAKAAELGLTTEEAPIQ